MDLERLAAVPEKGNDTNGISELEDGPREWIRRRLFHHPVKQQVTVRADADALAQFKSAGREYQFLMNAILRQAKLNAK